jgi:DNA-binding MarR family transcriptional regulator
MNTTTIIPAAVIIPCDDRCMFAKEEDCDCQCGGVNHQRGHLLTAVQRAIPRTRVGRRIPLLTPGTPEWDIAWAMYEAREDGDTQRDIAAEFGVSAPTVRRYIKSLLFTIATADAQAAEQAA